jgi:hypothetical protein
VVHSRTSTRGTLAAIALALGAALTPAAAGAYDASIGWEPAAAAAGYTLFVRYDDGEALATDVGRPSPDSDGLVRVSVEALPLGPTASFSVAAYDAAGSESAKSAPLSITYAQAAAVSDSDGDGLTDATEDADLDDNVDAGETDPDDADSDGDGFDDAEELGIYGTDPLDASSTPSIATTTTTLAPLPLPPTTTTTLPPQCSSAADCGDTDPCTTDSCVSGECVYAAAASGACDDGDPCTVGDACSAGACVGWALDCSHLDGPCTYGACDASLAECKATALADGSRCNDGSACTTGDACTAGVCGGSDACTGATFCEASTKTCRARTEVWISAAADKSATFGGTMTSGPAYADGDDRDVVADSLEPSLLFASSTKNDMKATSGDEVSYFVDLPAAGQWYLWGRFYYPGRPGSNDANSFFVRVNDGDALRFGNNKDYFRRWHWGGDGRRESGTPRALPLGELAAGAQTLTIAKREVSPIAPRLDVLVLTQDPAWIPVE